MPNPLWTPLPLWISTPTTNSTGRGFASPQSALYFRLFLDWVGRKILQSSKLFQSEMAKIALKFLDLDPDLHKIYGIWQRNIPPLKNIFNTCIFYSLLLGLLLYFYLYFFYLVVSFSFSFSFSPTFSFSRLIGLLFSGDHCRLGRVYRRSPSEPVVMGFRDKNSFARRRM